MAIAKLVVKGDRFGRFTVVDLASSHRQPNGKMCRRVECICDCGNKVTVLLSTLRNGRSKSCGCYMKEVNGARIGKASTTHGNTPAGYNEFKSLFFVWNSMKQRCYNPNTTKYKDYGKRGITVCDEWRNSFEMFRDWSLQHGYYKQPVNTLYKDKLSIDRLDSNGNYEPDNCQWITVSENTKRKTIKIKF